MNKFLAEIIGTFSLVFFGCGTIVFMGGEVGLIGVSLAFGLTVVSLAYALGPTSGAHLNPAVSLGVCFAGKMTKSDCFWYSVSQLSGGIVATLLLFAMGGDVSSSTTMPGDYGVFSAFVFELVATFLFVTVILNVTRGENNYLAGLAIGFALIVIHLAGIKVSGASVNPARTLASNSFDVESLKMCWLYFAGPLLGGALAGMVHKKFSA